MFFGVPVKLGRNGIEDILEIDLTDKEKALVDISADSVREGINFLNGLKLW